jgi:hypothetical protein
MWGLYFNSGIRVFFKTAAAWVIFFLNRMNSLQGIVKIEQEAISDISIGSLHCFKISLKIRFQHAPVLSNDPSATQTARGCESSSQPLAV